MSYRFGIDVGGTFTDFILIDEDTGASQMLKIPSTPEDPSRAVVEGWRRLAASTGVDPAAITRVSHGTTVGTNALLEQRGSRVGLITTAGFREILHLARGQTPPPYGMWITMIKPDPLVDLQDTLELSARIGAGGEEVRPLDETEVRSHLTALLAAGIESLTVSLLNAYVNPAHEQRVRDIAADLAPELPVSLSSDVLREFREYERTLTTVVNAYLKPRIKGYLLNLGHQLAGSGLSTPVNVIRSDGGLMSLEAATERPVHTVLSGPAGGVAGATHLARHAGYDNILSFDMGGTSTDVSIVIDGQPAIERELTVGYYTVRTPALMIHTVGAGGGSIAHVPDLTRALRVGPNSAGADPGPAAYDRGGTEATVTDANAVLGYLPSKLLDGDFFLDHALAREAVSRVGDKLGLNVERSAQGILDIVNENMYSALRLVSIQRGHDPREFALFAFGGAGPLHANALARLLGSWPVIIPPSPGVLCAQGHVATDFRSEVSQTYIRRFDQIDSVMLTRELNALGREANGWLEREGVAPEARSVVYEVGLRYYLQGVEASLPVTLEELTDGLDLLAERHGAHHQQLYGFRLDAVCETVNLRAIALGASGGLSIDESPPASADASAAITAYRPLYINSTWVEAPHYDRSLLMPGNKFQGPAVVNQPDSTVLVLDGHVAKVDPFSNILIWPEGQDCADRVLDA